MHIAVAQFFHWINIPSVCQLRHGLGHDRCYGVRSGWHAAKPMCYLTSLRTFQVRLPIPNETSQGNLKTNEVEWTCMPR